jgi:hypothetical protein
LRLADGVVDRAVSGTLLCLARAVICARVGAGVLIVHGLAGNLMVIGIISTGCGSKRLQVSDQLSSLRVPNTATAASSRLWGSQEDGIIGVGLDVLLEILRSLEGFAAKVALVGLERDVHANVRSDVITLDSRCAAIAPLTSEVQVVGALAADMALADVVIKLLCGGASLTTVLPLADERVAANAGLRERLHIVLCLRGRGLLLRDLATRRYASWWCVFVV